MVRKTRSSRSASEGFSIVELLITVAILSIISAIAMPVFLNQQEFAEASAKDTWAKANANSCAQLLFTGQEDKFSAQDGPDGTEAPAECTENQTFEGGNNTYTAKKSGQTIQTANPANNN